MKIWNYLLIASTIFLASGNTFASESKGTDYYPDYYENEGNLLFKLRGFYASTSAKNSSLPAPTNAGAASPGERGARRRSFSSTMRASTSMSVMHRHVDDGNQRTLAEQHSADAHQCNEHYGIRRCVRTCIQPRERCGHHSGPGLRVRPRALRNDGRGRSSAGKVSGTSR